MSRMRFSTLQLCKFVPTLEIENVKCYVLYDCHPSDNKKLSIIICTKNGEVKEFFEKNLVSSVLIHEGVEFQTIKSVRNNKVKLFYLVQANNELIILSRNNHLSIFKRFKPVHSCYLTDSKCTGDMELVLLKKHNQTTSEYVRLSVDNDFTPVEPPNTVSVEHNLKKKLKDVEYILQCNNKAHEHILDLRLQVTTLNHSLEDNISNKFLSPIVRFCNKKIVILMEVENPYMETIDKVNALIHNNGCNSISYTSKVFKHLVMSPFYEEKEDLKIERQNKALVTAVIPIKELNVSCVSGTIDFNVVVSYQRQGKCNLFPYGNINISVSDMLRNSFDVFHTAEISENLTVLAMLATTEKTTLQIKDIELNTSPQGLVLSNLFCNYLQMELLSDNSNIAIHKQSLCRTLNGMMVVFHPTMAGFDQSKEKFQIDVYSRSQDQVRALINLIPSIPHRLLVMTSNIRMTPKNFLHYKFACDYSQSSYSLLKQLTLTLEFLEDCRANSEPGIDINIFAKGFDRYSEYRERLLAEYDNCIEALTRPDSLRNNFDAMDCG